MKVFSPINIPNIFGYEDAADENITRLKEYFFKRSDYDTIVSDLPLSIVVGFKGVGKSALLKVAYEENIDTSVPALWIRPDDIAEMLDEFSESKIEFSKMVALWKRGISKLIASRIAKDWLYASDDDAAKAIIWAQESGYRSRDLIQKITSMIQGAIKRNIVQNDIADMTQGEQQIVARLLQDKKIILYFDDLDAGWEATASQRKRLSALILALRNMTSDIHGLKARLALRTDVYTLLRESDESTDKFENYVINCNWNNHDILILLIKRILTYFNSNVDDKKLKEMSLSELNDKLGLIMDKKFRDTKDWRGKPTNKVIASLIRSRPRDMIKLCTLAAKEAYKENENAEKIKDTHFEKIISEYSLNRVQDIVNEFKYELQNLNDLIYRMAPTRKEIQEKRKNIFVYTTAQLLEKIKNIQSNVTLRLVYKDSTTPMDIAHFLYKIGFITARKVIDKKIERKYYDEKKQLLKSGQIGDGGYDWEVHPAYRSAILTQDGIHWAKTLEVESL